MLNDITSRHLRNANELLVLAPIKQGFVPTIQTLSYASRLRMLLKTMHELHRLLVERELGWAAGPIERLQSIFNSQWTVLADDSNLLVTVSFDRSWEEYFERLVRYTGPALDAIFCHCEGYSDYSCVGPDGQRRFQGFPAFIRQHQVSCDFYYATAPDLTVDDLTYMGKLAAERNPSVDTVAKLRVGTAQEEIWLRQRDAELAKIIARGENVAPKTPEEVAAERAKATRQADAQRVLPAFFGLRDWFPAEPEAEPGAQQKPRSAQAIFDAAVRSLVPSLDELVTSATPATPLERWIAALKQAPTPSPGPAAEPPVPLDSNALHTIQGNILTPYAPMTHGCVVLLRCDTAADAGRFLAEMAKRVTSQADASGDGPFTNLALTFWGLKRIGLSDDVLQWFPKELREGMEQRSGALGDIGDPNHPDYWQLPTDNWQGANKTLREHADGLRVPLAAIDFVVTLQVKSDKGHAWPGHPLQGHVAELAELGARILHVQPLRHEVPAGGPVVEHFGFGDGVSQPIPNITLADRPLAAGTPDLLPLGEILLGYRDNRGEVAWCADPKRNQGSSALFENGSFLVLRKLEQDIAAFDAFAARNALGKSAATNEDAVKSWTLGRKLQAHGGEPLAAQSAQDNAFTYASDPRGEACPFAAHIRRANARVTDADGSPLPRIMRRGFSYGPKAGNGAANTATGDATADRKQGAPERGLMFMAYNASIAGQFEVIQRWLNGGNITGVLSAQNDLFTGAPQPTRAPHFVYADGAWRMLHAPPQQLVSLRWGLYTFAPSAKALGWLAERLRDPKPAQDPEIVKQGLAIIAALEIVERTRGPKAARTAWKTVIEEPMNVPKAIAVWAAIRARGGTLQTPYGLLVGSGDGAKEVLSGDGQRFSVREYWHRLRETTGEHYLAFDPEPRHLPSNDPTTQLKHAAYEARLAERGASYAELSKAPNQFILDNFNEKGLFSEGKVYDAALGYARQVLDAAMLPADDGQRRGQIKLPDLATLVVAKLSRDWFGMPAVERGIANEAALLCAQLMPFVLGSELSFQPYPEPTLTRAATQQGQAVRPAGTPRLASAFARDLEQRGCDPEAIRHAVVGSIVGFAAPTIGCVVTVINQWTALRELWPLAEAWNATGRKPESLKQAVQAALCTSPIPPLLYRTAMPGSTLADQPIEAGTLVVVGLGSVANATGDREWLFGGARGKNGNPHGCPGRGAAMGAVTGIVASLLERKDLRDERPLVLSFGAGPRP